MLTVTTCWFCLQGRRLPTEAEWEMAALCAPDPEGGGGLLLNADGEAAKRTYPWGKPPAIQAHLGP